MKLINLYDFGVISQKVGSLFQIDSLLTLMTISDELIKLSRRRDDLLANGLSRFNLLNQRLRDILLGSWENLVHSFFQAWALLVHFLEDLETFIDDIEVCFLL